MMGCKEIFNISVAAFGSGLITPVARAATAIPLAQGKDLGLVASHRLRQRDHCALVETYAA